MCHPSLFFYFHNDFSILARSISMKIFSLRIFGDQIAGISTESHAEPGERANKKIPFSRRAVAKSSRTKGPVFVSGPRLPVPGIYASCELTFAFSTCIVCPREATAASRLERDEQIPCLFSLHYFSLSLSLSFSLSRFQFILSSSVSVALDGGPRFSAW